MRAVALLLSVAPFAAPAQDLTAQEQAAITEYGAVYQTFGIGDMSHDWDQMVAQTDAMLTDLTGTWINAGQLSAGPELNLDYLSRACERSISKFERRGVLGFALIRQSQDLSVSANFSYIFGRAFQVSVDPDQMQNFLGIPEDRRPFQSVYTNPAGFGVVSVFHPSPLTLVIQPMVGTADIYVRCP
jgi:hypothetical protein